MGLRFVHFDIHIIQLLCRSFLRLVQLFALDILCINNRCWCFQLRGRNVNGNLSIIEISRAIQTKKLKRKEERNSNERERGRFVLIGNKKFQRNERFLYSLPLAFCDNSTNLFYYRPRCREINKCGRRRRKIQTIVTSYLIMNSIRSKLIDTPASRHNDCIFHHGKEKFLFDRSNNTDAKIDRSCWLLLALSNDIVK